MHTDTQKHNFSFSKVTNLEAKLLHVFMMRFNITQNCDVFRIAE